MKGFIQYRHHVTVVGSESLHISALVHSLSIVLSHSPVNSDPMDEISRSHSLRSKLLITQTHETLPEVETYTLGAINTVPAGGDAIAIQQRRRLPC